MSDEEMVAYLARCQLDPAMPRCSIETLLHAFVPAAHVHHTHPDGINVLAGAADGEALVQECFGDDAAWIPYIRPGFTLVQAGRRGGPRRPDAAPRRPRQARPGHLGRQRARRPTAHDRGINQAVDFVNERTDGSAALRRARAAAPRSTTQRREALLDDAAAGAARGGLQRARQGA